MTSFDNVEIVWGLGLSPNHSEAITAAMGAGYRLVAFDAQSLPRRSDFERDDPLAVWVSRQTWKNLPKRLHRLFREEETAQRIMILDAESTPEDMDDILAGGFLCGVAEPLAPRKVCDAIYRAKETRGLFHDVLRMTREIMLEREIFARKSDQLHFLCRLPERLAEAGDVAGLLGVLAEELHAVAPVRTVGLCMVLPGGKTMLGLPRHLPNLVREGWRSHLRDLLKAKGIGTNDLVHASYVCGHTGEDMLPAEAPCLDFPLRLGSTLIGYLSLSLSQDVSFGRDEMRTFKTAMQHVALTAHAFASQAAPSELDLDAMTGLPAHASFEHRLEQETRRSLRHGRPLSLVLIGLAKPVAGSVGSAMAIVGEAVRDTIRLHDFAARISEEEIAVLLPETGEEQAWQMAARLRGALADACAKAGLTSEVRLFVNMGVAGHQGGSELLAKADRRLHEAHAAGCGRIMGSFGELAQRAV